MRPLPVWQRALQDAFTRPAELLDFLGIDPSLPILELAQRRAFPLRVPRGYAARMRKGDPRDPLFLQVWPSPREADVVEGFSEDAVGDLAKLKDGGLIQKYEGRALVVATGACGVHCRFCFRRHFPYSDALASRDHWQSALKQIAADRSISEVILSGGDPLSLTDDKLAELTEALEFVGHVKRLRIHTRQPIVLPERVDEGLLCWLARGRLQKVMVVHANHANEIDAAVAAALRSIRDAGVTVLNQSVLLRGVNDNVDAQHDLAVRLFECGAMPYYLHLLDRVQGTAHFEVRPEEGASIVQQLSARLPGYLVPKLVREEAGAPAKTPVLGPAAVLP
ncbi:MAG TPA: EF-P beta-lysylation protein EpmB [Nevskiaceae bacterium]|nr:EF-P beta-lysylation protein EpmB [Nevskiaceae bacterium]